VHARPISAHPIALSMLANAHSPVSDASARDGTSAICALSMHTVTHPVTVSASLSGAL
jgi:hypothetical protein